MTVKVAVKDLTMGMFVAELDRPWLDTPFMLQGFILDNEEDLARIQLLCNFVFVDPATSTPSAVAKLSLPRPKAEADAERPQLKSSADLRVIITNTEANKKPSLFAGFGKKQMIATAAAARLRNRVPRAAAIPPSLTIKTRQSVPSGRSGNVPAHPTHRARPRILVATMIPA